MIQIQLSREGDEYEYDETETSPVARFSNMLVGKDASWKSARARLPPARQLWHMLRSSRAMVVFGIFTLITVIWRSMVSDAAEMQR